MAVGDACTGFEPDFSWEKAFCQVTTSYCAEFQSTCTNAIGWTNAANAKQDDGTFATADVVAAFNDCAETGIASPWQENTGYTFHIPSDATIQGVMVAVKGKCPAGTCGGATIGLANFAYIVGGTKYAAAGEGCVFAGFLGDCGPIPGGAVGSCVIDSNDWPINPDSGSPQPDVVGVIGQKSWLFSDSISFCYGLAHSVLGAPILTPALVNAADFGAAVIANDTCDADTAYLDCIGICVYYSSPSGCFIPSPYTIVGDAGQPDANIRSLFNVFNRRHVWGGR